jgi:hypothetical protein
MYFSTFPKTAYSFDFENQGAVVATNIFSRFKVRSQVLNNAFAFYKYQLVDGDTPDVVSFKQYNDTKYHWVICLANDIFDGQFDFPLSIEALEKNIIKKYGYTTIEQSMAATHHYEQVVEKTLALPSGFSSTTTETSEVSLQQYDYSTGALVLNVVNTPTTETATLRANNADLNSAVTGTLTITTTYRAVNVYDYEIELNESKREINILKSQYVTLLADELDTVLNG